MNMNRLQKLFSEKSKNLLSVYFTAGFPELDSTVPVINELSSRGVDMIEIGVPFSDPMADGPTIQSSSTVALRNGISLRRILNDVAEARNTVRETPLVLMGYLNPFIQFGIEKLFEKCAEAGIDAMIIPDLPFKEYMESVKPLCDRYDIPVIMLKTPETSEERIRMIDDNCSGFIYMVSSASTTGTRDKFSNRQIEYFESVNKLMLKNPRLIGFGISNKATLTSAHENASGAIVGSLFIKCLEKKGSRYSEAVDMLLDTLKK